MIIRHRFFLLIQALWCAATVHGILLNANDAETCNLLCVQCNASAVFANDHCECNFADGNDKVSGEECVRRIQREILAIEQNMLSENPTDEERNVRSILKYRRRLRPGDAEKVAQYFINGGPAAGHSHFIKAFNSADSATNSFSGVVDESNPEDGFHGVLLTSPVSSNTYNSPLYMVSEFPPYASPTMQGTEMYPPFIRAANPAITYPINGLYDPTTPLGSIVHPRPLHALARAITFPAHVLHHILHPRVYHLPHHRVGLAENTNSPQVSRPRYLSINPSGTPDQATVDQQCENNDDSTSNLPTAKNNAEKPAEQNVLGLTTSPQYPYIIQSLYQPEPMQYEHFPYQYTSYYSPLWNVLHPTANNYILQPTSHYAQGISDPLTSASNPQFSCGNNVNTEQRNAVLTTNKAVYSNEETEKPDNAIRNNISKEEKKTEKNRTTTKS